MFRRPLSLIIGLRYTRAKRRTHFVSFISGASFIGIAIGVMVLITALSIMNGFNQQIRERFFAITPAVTVMTTQNISATWQALAKEVSEVPQVTGVAPYVAGNGMIMQGKQFSGISLMGILPSEEQKISPLSSTLKAGKLSSLAPGKFHAVIGEELAEYLHVTLGDTLLVMTPQTTVSLAGVFPRSKVFTITGIYHTMGGLYDRSLVFISMQDAERLFLPEQRESGLHVQLRDLYLAPEITEVLQQQLPMGYGVTDWTAQFGAFFEALAMEKTILYVVLLLIVAVAAFNLVSSLVMVVNEKRADIAILRTLGASPRTILLSFVVQGAIVGLLGIFLGVLCGVALAANVTVIADGLQQLFHIQFVRESVFFINFVPSEILLSDVVGVSVAAFCLSLLATIYPALMAAKTEPAEALRYE